LDSQSFKGYWNLGDAALLEGQYVEAIIQYEHALALSPGNPILERQLARARSGARKVLFGGNR
jgi:cytochrome c-type biogenesis protein CcmH/NrfG